MGQPWADWIGRSETLQETIDPRPARAMAAALDLDEPVPKPGQDIPALWIWAYFTPSPPMRELGPDGHPKRGGFLPPIPAPRRMWAGSRCVLHGPLKIAAEAVRASTILSISEKTGRAGPMTFVTVRHVIRAQGALVFEEEQDLVYMPIPERYAPPPPALPPPLAWSEPVAIDPVTLFRFSALTFNAHRIHYDRPYATEVEAYPGLVVHGPLQAVLMFHAGLRHSPHRVARRFEFRGVRPLFDFDSTHLAGAPHGKDALDLFTLNGDGLVCSKARLSFTA
jgi:3-methylfumaryl-CoA hydratase